MNMRINSGITSNYTKIPNQIFEENQLTPSEKILFCCLLRHCGNDDYCFPNQDTLATEIGITTARQVRNILIKLEEYGLIYHTRRGFNRSNTYKVSKDLILIRKESSYQLGSAVPLHQGNELPPNSTYLKGKGKRCIKSIKERRKELIRKLSI